MLSLSRNEGNCHSGFGSPCRDALPVAVPAFLSVPGAFADELTPTD